MVTNYINSEKERNNSFIKRLHDNRQLVNRFKNGDEKAFDIIVKCYHHRLIRTAKIWLISEQEAIDSVQDLFVELYFKLHSFHENEALEIWMYRILYNHCLSLMRRKKIVSFLLFDIYEKDRIILHADDPVSGTVYEKKRIETAVYDALVKLPFKQRTVFFLRQIDRLKFLEISSIIGSTEGEVKISYFYAIKKLQKFFSRKEMSV